MRISDWSSDVCSSDLRSLGEHDARLPGDVRRQEQVFQRLAGFFGGLVVDQLGKLEVGAHIGPVGHRAVDMAEMALQRRQAGAVAPPDEPRERSEEHTSELQSLMRISYAVFCLKKKKR